MDKAALRSELRTSLAALSADERARQSDSLVQLLKELPEIGSAGTVLGFWPMATEPDLRPLFDTLLGRGVTVALPSISDPPEHGPRMRARTFTGEHELRPHRWGLMEPTGELLRDPPGIILVPCLGITRKGERLGHGGGYYDEFLLQAPNAITIAPALRPQLIPSVPLETHDQRVQMVVTPTEVIHCGSRA